MNISPKEAKVGFITFLFSGFALQSEYSFQHLIKLMEVIAPTEATAAPAIPKGGIKMIFNPTLTTAIAKVAHIINRDSPMAIKVAPLGPRKLFMINPRDNILSVLVAKM